MSYSVTRIISGRHLPLWSVTFTAVGEGCFCPIATGSTCSHTLVHCTIRPSATGHKVLLLQRTLMILAEIKIYCRTSCKDTAEGGISKLKKACLFFCSPNLQYIQWWLLYWQCILALTADMRDGGKALIQSKHKKGKQAQTVYNINFSTLHKVTSLKQQQQPPQPTKPNKKTRQWDICR